MIRPGPEFPVVLATYSTKPRGGVVHTLELAAALQHIGEPVHLVSLGDPEEGFFRPTPVPATIFPAPLPAPTLEERVAAAVDALAAGLEGMAQVPCIVHTQDCIAARAACRQGPDSSSDRSGTMRPETPARCSWSKACGSPCRHTGFA